MWIRSQDKKTLVKVDMVELLNYENSIVAYTSIKVGNLGKYSTKEKALKVLDMIVNYIDSGGKMFVTDQHKTDFGMSAVYEKKLGVFQMPKDDEVEE